MMSDEAGSHGQHLSHPLELSAETLAHLSPEDLLQVCLQYRQLLLTLKEVLYTPDASLTTRVVAMDLLYLQAQREAHDQIPDESEQVVFIKQVSERLGLQPKAVRAAYAKLEQRGAIAITDIRFPWQRRD